MIRQIPVRLLAVLAVLLAVLATQTGLSTAVMAAFATADRYGFALAAAVTAAALLAVRRAAVAARAAGGAR